MDAEFGDQSTSESLRQGSFASMQRGATNLSLNLQAATPRSAGAAAAGGGMAGAVGPARSGPVAAALARSPSSGLSPAADTSRLAAVYGQNVFSDQQLSLLDSILHDQFKPMVGQ